MTFKVTYGRTANGVHIELSQECSETHDPEVEYERVKAFVEAKLAELKDKFEV